MVCYQQGLPRLVLTHVNFIFLQSIATFFFKKIWQIVYMHIFSLMFSAWIKVIFVFANVGLNICIHIQTFLETKRYLYLSKKQDPNIFVLLFVKLKQKIICICIGQKMSTLVCISFFCIWISICISHMCNTLY